ncbi:MAG: SGNH/GDSL hydrolase family protein, partial [Verrucomicrobiales bacterium]
MKNLILGLTAAAGILMAISTPAQELSDPVIIARSQVSLGDTARLGRVLAKARRGEGVTIGVIGGSITQGAKASGEAHRYGNLIAQWWRDTFPAAQIKFVNAGIGATGSNYGAMRLTRDLLGANPDFVVVEYAVNDPNVQDSAETLEGIVRQLLKQPNQPAVMLLFMMNQSGSNAQEWMAKVGAHYKLPMASYRDALWPEIGAKRLQWSDISPDEVHPNDRGMAAAARFVTVQLDAALAALPADDKLPAVTVVPTPLFTDLYEHTALLEAAAMQPVSNAGFAYDAQRKIWKSDVPGSVIEFEIAGSSIFTMHFVIKRAMGRAKVTVDGANEKILDGWFNQTWGGFRQTNRIAQNLPPGKHRVRFEVLAQSNPGSDGHEFQI